MKYTDKVTFITETEQHYDPDLGEEVGGDLVKETILAHVSSPSMQKSALVFGDLKTTDLLIHLKQPYDGTFNYCLINGSDEKFFFVTQKQVGRRRIIAVRGDSNESINVN